MLFASSIFIFGFLPLILTLYYICKKNRKLSNIILLIASLAFYAFGEPRFVIIMMISIIINWWLGMKISKTRKNLHIVDKRTNIDSDPNIYENEDYQLENKTNIHIVNKTVKQKQKTWLAIGIVFNIAIIFIFKYLMFVMGIVNQVTPLSMEIPLINLPIGISFYTFQSISYLIDVYREKGQVQKNLLNVALYIAFFPQLIAGPIVRYETIANQLEGRKESFALFSEGVRRFIVGLGKKVIIANQMALIADAAHAANAGGQISIAFAWLGSIAYTLQIYYDFGGYSDMAIGLGKMFGFEFLENFNYPYISKSITEFWRRWHISLSTWFRDYVYIPLGGSRVKSPTRHICNIFIVWLLTGIWHGAAWNFIAWGLGYFVLLIIEKYVFARMKTLNKNGNKNTNKSCEKHKLSTILINTLKTIYTLFFVNLGWVLFRAEGLGAAWSYIKSMFGVITTDVLANNTLSINNSINTLTKLSGKIVIENQFYLLLDEKIVFIILGILFSMPLIKILEEKLEKFSEKNKFLYIIENIASSAVYLAILMITVSFLLKETYNPFIYFNF